MAPAVCAQGGPYRTAYRGAGSTQCRRAHDRAGGHADDIVANIARTVGIIFRAELVENIDDRRGIYDIVDRHQRATPANEPAIVIRRFGAEPAIGKDLGVNLRGRVRVQLNHDLDIDRRNAHVLERPGGQFCVFAMRECGPNNPGTLGSGSHGFRHK